MDYLGISTLFVSIVILVVTVLAMRSAQKSVELAERRQEYLLEERQRMEFMREEHKSLREELERERQESQGLQEALKRERQERLQAQHSAEVAQQKLSGKLHSSYAIG
jgi:predicted Holliday junction resolvase-like endonuclease